MTHTCCSETAALLEEVAPRPPYPTDEAWGRAANAIIAQWRRDAMASQAKLSRSLISLLTKMQRQMAAQVTRAYAKGAPTRFELSALKARLQVVAANYTRDLTQLVEHGIVSASDAAAAREASVAAATYADRLPVALRAIVTNPLSATDMGKALNQILLDRAEHGGLTLSQRLWSVGQYTEDRVTAIIRRGVEKQLDIRQIARALQRELVPATPVPGRPFGINNVTGLSKGLTVGPSNRAGSVAWQYTRIARTEVVRAARAATEARSMFLQAAGPLNPNRGVRWNLSSAHKEKDICDSWATQDADGLGSGVYKPGHTPLGHPNDMCYTTTEIIQLSAYARGIDKLIASASPEELQAYLDAATRSSLSNEGRRAMQRMAEGQLIHDAQRRAG